MGIIEDECSDLQISFLMQKLAQRKVSLNWEESGDYRLRGLFCPTELIKRACSSSRTIACCPRVFFHCKLEEMGAVFSLVT